MLIARPEQAPTLTLTLPMPPGSNHRLMPVTVRGKERLALHPQARAWLEAAEWDVSAQRRGISLENRCAALISLSPSNMDGDAPIKLLFDACQRGGAVSNDRHIRPYGVIDDEMLSVGLIRMELWDTGEAMNLSRRNDTDPQASLVRRALARTFR